VRYGELASAPRPPSHERTRRRRLITEPGEQNGWWHIIATDVAITICNSTCDGFSYSAGHRRLSSNCRFRAFGIALE
jgi:hypothetical protein